MDIRAFFAMAAHNLVNRYLDLIQGQRDIDKNHLHSGAGLPQPLVEGLPIDSYEPSEQAPNTPVTEHTPVECPAGTEVDENNPPQGLPEETAQPPQPNVNPDGTYFFRRSARLDYQLNLRFDLHAVTQTVQQLSDGDLEALETYAAANFGLAAAMTFKGKQVVETNMPGVEGEAAPPTHVRGRSLLRAHQVRQIGIQSRHFAVRAFHREATHMMESLKVTEQDGYQRAVNKFAYRFTMDSRLSFAFLERFNVQTGEVAGQMPESLSDYLTSAGNAAEKATPEIMGAFFDAVDAYLNDAEEQIIQKVNQFFDMAAEQLGFSGELVDFARDQLVETVESFFNRVDNALEGLESHFIPSELVQVTLPINEPTVLPADYENPAVVDQKAQVAVA